jgi:hypothetical protein
MTTETSNMKPNEPSRTALMITRQRAAHQMLDHGSILDDAIEDINYHEISSRFGRAVQGLAPGHAGVHFVHARH